MSMIKNFFQKKKMDIKFKQAGSGKKLGDSSSSASRPPSQGSSRVAAVRKPSSDSSARAAHAALSRFEGQSQNVKSRPASATASWKHSSTTSPSNPAVDVHETRREHAAESETGKRSRKESNKSDEDFQLERSESGIIFVCPMCPISLPESEISSHIESCLYKELEQEPAMVAASMIHTLNKDREKVNTCVEILNKYLNNIIKNPSEEKYRKIKQSNKIFKEKVLPLRGVKELLTIAIGFVDVKLPIQIDGKESMEDFYVLSEDLALDTDKLSLIKEYMDEAEPLTANLDRNLTVFEPAANMSKFSLPPEFYKLTSKEIKNEQMKKSETVEKSKQLRTKAMKEADDAKVKRVYRFTLIRIRFPDGNVLQGTFYSKEKLSELKSFVRECLELDWIPFEVTDATGQKLTDDNKTLQEYQLSPAALLNFSWDKNIATDIAATNNGVQPTQYLTNQLIMNIQPFQ